MDLMIDLETLGTKPECPVISIGAVFFSVENKAVLNTPENMFYRCLEIQNQLNSGRVLDADTIKWWMGQADAAKHVFKETAKDPKEVLISFVQFVKKHEKAQVWGNGSTFDISILESLFRTYNIECPWSYNSIMDLRTFKRFVAGNKKVQKLGVDHNALDDAISQAKYVVENLK